MKRFNFYLFVTMAMLMLSVRSAWAQYVKLTAEDGTISWIEIEGTINGTSIEIYKGYQESAIAAYTTKGSIDLNEVWSQSGGSGTHYQVTSIGDWAFYGCSGLTSIEIPSSVTSIEKGAFIYCRGLTSIDIPSSVTSIGYEAFFECSGLTSVVIPSSVTSIGSAAFHYCSGLTSIVIPSSVTSIGGGAFRDCSGLTSVVIPSSVTSIGGNAFYGCSGLTTIISYITDVFETGQYAFKGCENVTLYVPKGLLNFYRLRADWNRIKKIEEMPGVISGAFVMSCNNKGKVLINGTTEFTNDLGEVNINDGEDNTFVFQPNNNCELRQVLIDGLDVTLSVENNQLTTKVHVGSKMIVIFDKTGSDVNGDGRVDISDVVALVNVILGQ